MLMNKYEKLWNYEIAFYIIWLKRLEFKALLQRVKIKKTIVLHYYNFESTTQHELEVFNVYR